MAFPSLFMAFHHLLVLVLLIFSFPLSSSEPPAVEKQALLSFFTQVLHSDRLTWNSSDSPCNWIGVQCDTNRIHVVSLRLPAAGLIGVIPSATLGLLADLRVLSLHSNRLSAPLPSDFANLTSLHSLFLHRNQLSGEFPGQLIGLTLLTRLDLSFNNFVGKIPASITNLTSLTGLFLQDNSFNGSLPAIKIQSLVNFNVSDNNLTGPIPATLSRFPQSSFAGNIALCGSPLAPCSAPPPPPPAPPTPPRPSPTPAPNPPQKSNDRISRTSIIAIAAASGGGLLLLLVLILLLCLMMRRKRAPKPVKSAAGEAGSAVATAGVSPSKDETGSSGSAAAAAIGNISTSTNKLVFVDGGIHGFDLEDMLRASAEVLGKGSVGMTYKAVLEEGTAVAVKRLREVAVGKREFGVQMEALGKMRHDNVVAFRAYYYSKDEKLVVSDFMTGGSLSTLLHGNKGGGRTELDWDKRLSIAVAAGRGIAHLHSSGRLPHGNIKASNVLLHPTRVACVSDYGLNSVLPRAAQPDRAAASYRAPEAADTRKATFKSDVYSFGVLLLELLTGKAACGAPPGGEGADLPRWVETVVAEAWTEEVFDEEMVKGRRREGEEEEMVQLLQVAMACVAKLPDERPSMQDVVRMMEEVGQEAADVGREEEVAG